MSNCIYGLLLGCAADVYQFDDATATFNCYTKGAPTGGPGDDMNLTNYEITFCSANGGSIQ